MDHGQGMEGMGMKMEMGMKPPPSSSNMHHKMMMHMTFFWGNNAQILFPNWPGTHSGMYALALVFVFFFLRLSLSGFLILGLLNPVQTKLLTVWFTPSCMPLELDWLIW